MGRILAIDYGQSRIGLALSDPMKIIAQPFKTIPNQGITPILEEIEKIIRENDVESVLVGMPVSMSGKISEQGKIVQQFFSLLKSSLKIPVIPVDERLSSVEARKRLQQKGVKTGHDKGAVDAMSAAIILETELMKL